MVSQIPTFPTCLQGTNGAVGTVAQEHVRSYPPPPQHPLLLSLPACSVSVLSAWSTLPSLPPQALLVLYIPALNLSWHLELATYLSL